MTHPITKGCTYESKYWHLACAPSSPRNRVGWSRQCTVAGTGYEVRGGGTANRPCKLKWVEGSDPVERPSNNQQYGATSETTGIVRRETDTRSCSWAQER
ncbi:hypothetical protein M408DRAFT_130840 [Serendipita vermifera MAFF 305830]|uniref:Uncharacterized protein n=1 Tax=Serendipita vermifera MAFF 305830 TaxID=933852 RepID=A0A0C2W1Z8_SERVB|nr:hypothetical protein M408DRAFT_130840 [Serendipita vermifera MAFF 305830]